ncbi:MAG: DUF799 family lipoprotein [Opitutae bacterium]|nr:DUF799 family lipoprotein [Opitutae bacterium]
MKTFVLLAAAGVFLLSGCATLPPKNYAAFRQSNPRSILVLPPVNESNEVIAPYSLLTTVTRPLSELGYYVIPVVMADHLLKENGMSLPAEMHQAPLEKLRSVFGADAVLYITIEKYGSKYQLVASNTMVFARAKLVDARTGTELWQGRADTTYGGQSGLIEALVEQVMNKLVDQAHNVAAMASLQLLTVPGQGLLKGPRHPEFGKDPR